MPDLRCRGRSEARLAGGGARRQPGRPDGETARSVAGLPSTEALDPIGDVHYPWRRQGRPSVVIRGVGREQHHERGIGRGHHDLHGQRSPVQPGRRPGRPAGVGAALGSGSARCASRLRDGIVRGLHGAGRRRCGQVLHHPARDRRRPVRGHAGGPGHALAPRRRATVLSGRAGRAVRVLHQRHHHDGRRPGRPAVHRRRHPPGGPVGAPVPLRRAPAHPESGTPSPVRHRVVEPRGALVPQPLTRLRTGLLPSALP